MNQTESQVLTGNSGQLRRAEVYPVPVERKLVELQRDLAAEKGRPFEPHRIAGRISPDDSSSPAFHAQLQLQIENPTGELPPEL
jgi:hypothetical protein